MESSQFPLCYLFFLLQEFHLLRKEEETMTGQDALIPLLPAGIIIYRDNKIGTILEVLFDGLHSCSFSFQQHIESIGTCLWMQTYSISGLHLPTSNVCRCRRRVILSWIVLPRTTLAWLLTSWPQAADCAVQFHELFWRESLRAL